MSNISSNGPKGLGLGLGSGSSKKAPTPTQSKTSGIAKNALGINAAAKKLGINATKPAPTPTQSKTTNVAKNALGPKPTAFKTADPKTTGKMKPTTPIIGANRGKGANFATVNADRMKSTIKKLGM